MPPTGDRTRPAPLSQTVSRQMQRMPRHSTTPELALRRALHARGLRYTLKATGLPARPDIVFTRARIAVFTDGCFWHRCPAHATAPKNNHDWWRQKLDANVARDRRQDTALAGLGWTVLRYWEHQLSTPADADTVAAAVQGEWERRRHGAPTGRPGSL